jgi:TetR/AcrR family transcriptional repressor of nem operon
VRDRIRRLEVLPNPGLAITEFFAEVLNRTLTDPLHRGCLLVNAALEATAEDPELRQAVATELDAIRTFSEIVCMFSANSGAGGEHRCLPRLESFALCTARCPGARES